MKKKRERIRAKLLKALGFLGSALHLVVFKDRKWSSGTVKEFAHA